MTGARCAPVTSAESECACVSGVVVVTCSVADKDPGPRDDIDPKWNPAPGRTEQTSDGRIRSPSDGEPTLMTPVGSTVWRKALVKPRATTSLTYYFDAARRGSLR